MNRYQKSYVSFNSLINYWKKRLFIKKEKRIKRHCAPLERDKRTNTVLTKNNKQMVLRFAPGFATLPLISGTGLWAATSPFVKRWVCRKSPFPFIFIPHFAVAIILDMRYIMIYLFKESHGTLQGLFLRTNQNDSSLPARTNPSRYIWYMGRSCIYCTNDRQPRSTARETDPEVNPKKRPISSCVYPSFFTKG